MVRSSCLRPGQQHVLPLQQSQSGFCPDKVIWLGSADTHHLRSHHYTLRNKPSNMAASVLSHRKASQARESCKGCNLDTSQAHIRSVDPQLEQAVALASKYGRSDYSWHRVVIIQVLVLNRQPQYAVRMPA